MEWWKPDVVVGTVLYSFIGVAMFWGSFLVVDKLTPYDLWKELVESRNVALAVVVAATHLGIAIIVAAAIH